MTAPLRVRLALHDGPGPEVDAYPTPVPALVISAWPLGAPGRYAVIHAASGMPLAARLPSAEAALGLACDLGTLADWTAPVDEAVVRQEAVAMARRWGWTQVPGSGNRPSFLAWGRAAGVLR